jgi:BolA family transcriptional regulator, general stress-responsive regulator
MKLNNEQRVEKIKRLLTEHLSPSTLDVLDESHLHAGHAGAKSGLGHFAVAISATEFAGKNPLECHRMIYAALGDMMQTDIHALRMIRITG